MSNLQSTVLAVVDELTNNNELFTALDVSNRVKLLSPNARHREVRDIVRDLFVNDPLLMGYRRSPITVSLEDGSTATALLYYPDTVDDSDLHTRYNDQQRSQTSFRPIAVAQAAVQAAQQQTVSAAVPQTATVTVSTTVPVLTARQAWDQLFTSQPSLFPTK